MADQTQKILPVGVQNFESLIRDGYLYVDKTETVWRLTHTGRHYFLARPRRFGKSLLLSTIEAYFEGKKELFDGLYLQTQEQDWISYPIDNRKKILVGLNFSSTTRRMTDWLVDEPQNKVVKEVSNRVSNGVSNRVPNWEGTTAVVLQLIKENPNITRKMIAEKIGIAIKNVQEHINKLKTGGAIRRSGSATFGGHWEIIE